MRGRLVLVAALTALPVSGCSPIGVPPPRPAQSSPLSTARRTHEYPSPPPAAQRAPGSASGEEAILAFAAAYVNWDAGTVGGDLRALAAASVGQARSAMALAAAQTGSDEQLRRGGIANHGTVEAVAPLRAGVDQYVVVTRESTTATGTGAYQGLAPAWHLTVATVRRLGSAGWVVSGWQPEN